MQNPFSWDYLTTPIHEMDVFGPFSIAYLILFGSVLLISAFMFADAPRRFANHKLNRDTVRRFANWLMWVSAIALLFFGIRATQTPFLTLEKRIWMYFSFLAFLIVVGYIVYFVRAKYPAQLAAFDRSRDRRQWQHAARRHGGQVTSRSQQTSQQSQPTERKRRAAR